MRERNKMALFNQNKIRRKRRRGESNDDDKVDK